ncbi:MAG TPA: exosortase A [Oleiagrimonas sp.]|nr:exosortase A [Oleiagrimonas sp.]
MNAELASNTVAPARTSGWPLALIAFVVAVIALLVGYWQTVQSLVGIWAHDGTYQYAFLIFPLSLWVAWNQRRQLAAQRPVPSLWGLLAVAALICVWYAGQALAINLLQHFALVALFPALVLACWGWSALRVLAFPLGYLVVFAVPWGDGLVGPLQDLTAHFSVGTLQLFGMPVLLNGREIFTPSATWMVEQACSGVKFFIACVAIGSLYAYLMYTRTLKRVVFVVLAAIVPIIANTLRVCFTIMIGETWGLHYATGTDHLIFGWQFFGTVLVLLLVGGWFFRDRVMPEKPIHGSDRESATTRRVVWPLALALLIAGPVLAGSVAPDTTPQRLDLSPPTLTGWKQSQTLDGSWQPTFNGAAGQMQATYLAATDGATVALFHAVYTGRPRRGHTLITYGNDVHDPDATRVLETTDQRVELADGTQLTARELRLTGKHGSRLIWYWYCVDASCTASPVWTKVMLAWRVLRGGAVRSSVWALSLPFVKGHEDRARKTLRAFAHTLPGPDARHVRTRGTPVLAGGTP